MKKVILALGLLLAVGAGCVSVGKLGGNKEVEGDWSLAFDLPSSWVMAAPYSEPSNQVVVLSTQVDQDDNEVYLQSIDKPIAGGGVQPDASVPTESYVTLGDNTQIRVSRLDPRRIISDEAEDLGNGFFKEKVCEVGEECQIYGRHNYDYYLKTDDANYKFVVYGQDIEQAEDVIMSAEVVTAAEESVE